MPNEQVYDCKDLSQYVYHDGGRGDVPAGFHKIGEATNGLHLAVDEDDY